MLPGEMDYRCLAPDEVLAVAALHGQALPGTLNSQLGQGHLARLYAAMQRDPECHVTVAWLEGQVVGVVCANLNPAHFADVFISGLTPSHWLALAGRLVLRPWLLLAWREGRNLNRPVRFQDQVVRPCLSAIAVAERCRRTGVGRALVERVEEWMRVNYQPAYYLDTLAANQPARAFYARLGFVEVEQRDQSFMLVKRL